MKKIVTILLVILATISVAQTSQEVEMINEINNLRTNPTSYIVHIEAYITKQEAILKLFKMGIATAKSSTGANGSDVITRNIKAANNAINVLKTTNILNSVTFNADMYEVTSAHADYIMTTKKIGHTNADGKRSSDRMKHLKLKGVTENIVGGGQDVIESIVILLVDSGYDDGGHRKNLLNPNSTKVSVSINDFICVQNFAN